MRRGPDEDDHHQHPGLHRNVIGHGRPAQRGRHGAGQAADDDVLRGRRFQDDGVDDGVADEGGEGQPHGQRIDQVVQHPHAQATQHAREHQRLAYRDFAARHRTAGGARHARIDLALDQAIDGEGRAGQQPDAQRAEDDLVPVRQVGRGKEHADHRTEHCQLRHARLGQCPVLGDAVGLGGQCGHGVTGRADAGGAAAARPEGA